MNTNFSVDSLIANALSSVDNDQINDLLSRYGLAWTVSKQPLVLPNGTATPYFGVVRDDNNTCFNTVKEGYTPYQNDKLAELVLRIAGETGYSIDRAGMFNGGGKVFIQLATGSVSGIGENRDTIKKYATAINSHDGSTSLRWGHTDVTISCQNTFNAAYRELKSSARHTRTINQQVEQSLRSIEDLRTVEQSIFDTYFKLAEVPVTKAHLVEVAKIVTTVDIQLTREQLQKEYSTYYLNRMDEFLQATKLEMQEKGQTLWGLMAGVTKYTTHIMPAPIRENGRLESKYVGNGYKTDNEVFSYLSKVVA